MIDDPVMLTAGDRTWLVSQVSRVVGYNPRTLDAFDLTPGAPLGYWWFPPHTYSRGLELLVYFHDTDLFARYTLDIEPQPGTDIGIRLGGLADAANIHSRVDRIHG